MTRWKKWIIDKFLPAWCRAELLEENQRLMKKAERQAATIERLNAYIDGMHDALRRQSKIIVNGGIAGEHHECDL